jgi:hypothetical protein
MKAVARFAVIGPDRSVRDSAAAGDVPAADKRFPARMVPEEAARKARIRLAHLGMHAPRSGRSESLAN